MADPTLLFLSDDQVLGGQVEEIVEGIPHLAFRVSGGVEAATDDDAWESASLVLIHQVDPGPALVSAARRRMPSIVLADPCVAEHAVEALRLGAADYLGLPLDAARLAELIDALTLRDRDRAVGGASRAAPSILDGDTPRVALLVDQIRRVSPGSATILLGGETGTGKTRLARQIHELSSRRGEPFLVINCGTLSESSAEGELFGHNQGTFDRPGKFADVGGGTLFLDGVDALPLALQGKVLKVVEDRAFEPVGGTGTLPFRARLIAASQRPLDGEVAEGRFRSDLYYRLNVVGFELPPLRERGDAIALLSDQFLKEFSRTEGREPLSIGDDALRALQEHDWPGNVRELRNVMARCAATCPDRSVRLEDLPVSVLDDMFRTHPVPNPAHLSGSSTFQWSPRAESRGEVELARIAQALEKHSNNRLRAAGELGISRMTLYKKLHKYGLIHPTPAPHGVV